MNFQLITLNNQPFYLVPPHMLAKTIGQKTKKKLTDMPIDTEALLVSEKMAIAAAQKDASSTLTYPHAVMQAICAGVHPIQAFRKFKKMSQKKLAEATGFNALYISHLETRQRPVSRTAMQKIAKALGVKPALLIEENND
jgi:DNA-binding Xre family transcriptional regulator